MVFSLQDILYTDFFTLENTQYHCFAKQINLKTFKE